MGCLLMPVCDLLAQNDSLAFHHARLRIWCETTRFVYEDNGADSLLPSVNCQSWEALNNSMAATDASLGVQRLMNSVDKPAVYQGFTSTEAKLQKLVTEISTRLKQSSVRRTNAVRLNRVDSLQQQLMLIARQVGAQSEELAATDNGAADDASAAQGPVVPVSDSATSATGTDLPWNEILQWLAILALGGYLFWRLYDLEGRYARLKREFRTLEKQVNEFVIATVSPGPMPDDKPPGLTETDVRKLVIDELMQLEEATKPELTKPDAATAAPAQQQELPKTPAAPAPVPPAPASTPAPASANKDADSALFYDKMPFRGGFHQNEMSRERQRDSIYTISVVPGGTGEAEYWVTEDPEVQRYAMQNGLSFFEEGCDFTEVEENPGRVVNEEKGRLRKDGSIWKIQQKAKVRFE
ncbi:hypothetical protein D770_24280 [Flammeovirgaceae bacterium 311]|nr:hypothetical protein D770_24280 [Flammeovirgaceae bacterium 311]